MEINLRAIPPIEIDEAGLPTDPQCRELFDNIQGNILKEHGRDNVLLLFLVFREDKIGEIKTFVARIFNDTDLITSGTQQLSDAKRYSEWRRSSLPHQPFNERLFVNFFLTPKGYALLGVGADHLPQDENQFFRQGRSQGDDWDPSYRQNIHAMMLLALDHKHLLNLGTLEQWATVAEREKAAALKNAADIRFQWETLATVSTEAGTCFYDKQIDLHSSVKDIRRPVEHFGFVDGISNPLFFAKEIRDWESREKVTPANRAFNPWIPLDAVLARDPNSSPYGYGSYLAFLKLEQHIEQFNTLAGRLGKTLGAGQELAEALVVGRFKDGTPAVLQDQQGLGAINNFDYASLDTDGMRCPLHAHVRKMNRRRSLESEVRIVRRGITYGERRVRYNDNNDLILGQANGQVGLLFMSFQSDISTFDTLFAKWSQEDEPRHGAGFDPTIGHGEKDQQWPQYGTEPSLKPFRFADVVTERGGQYFFSPSVGFLKNL